MHHHESTNAPLNRSWESYVPLIVVVLLTGLAAAAKQAGYLGPWNTGQWLRDFMGFFLVVFAMFKLFDLSGFADGFQKYDLLAKVFRPYALVYPFVELALGLGYLAGWQPRAVATATLIVLGFGAIGVLRALQRGLDIACACMGTFLRVPLSSVALIEDVGMAAMAALMLAMRA